MTRLTVERFEAPLSVRAARERAWAGARATDALAGRTVWCAAASPSGRAAARRLGATVGQREEGVAAAALDASADALLRALAQRLDAMLAGAAAEPLGPAERELCGSASEVAEAQMGRPVGRDDVVVTHDALTALLAPALRERGAHTVWYAHVDTGAAGAAAALAFLRRWTAPFDAYIMTWHETDAHGGVVERVAALMPSADVVAAKEVPSAASRLDDLDARRLAWHTALADVVADDRDDHVGGTLHVRPSVAVR
jgi:hypothetical protein